MTITGYDSAFEQATNERAEIRIEIEKLLNRGELLDKLLECLSPFVSSPKAVSDSSSHEASHQEHEQHYQQHQEHVEHHQG